MSTEDGPTLRMAFVIADVMAVERGAHAVTRSFSRAARMVLQQQKVRLSKESSLALKPETSCPGSGGKITPSPANSRGDDAAASSSSDNNGPGGEGNEHEVRDEWVS